MFECSEEANQGLQSGFGVVKKSEQCFLFFSISLPSNSETSRFREEFLQTVNSVEYLTSRIRKVLDTDATHTLATKSE